MSGESGSSFDQATSAEHKARLLLRSTELRARIGASCAVVLPLFGLVDRARAAAGAVDRHRPLVMIGLSALVGAVALRPRRFGRLALRGMAVWQFAARARPIVSGVSRWAFARSRPGKAQARPEAGNAGAYLP